MNKSAMSTSASSNAPNPAHQESSTPKSRACNNCARLKMKCRWPEDDSGDTTSCTRCSRMNITCDVPARSQRRKRGKSTRVAQLEQKIDGIMSFLAKNQQVQPTGPSPMTPESQFTCQTSPRAPVQETPQSHGIPRSTRSKNQAIFQLVPGFQLTAQEAANYLSIYTTEYAPNFPFVLIPSTMNPHSLHAESPGLFWAIMTAIAPQSFTLQQDVKTWFRQYIAEHMIVRQEKSLHLLQAILIHLAWGDFHFYINSEATNFLQLAFALVMDLRLDKSPESSAATVRSLLGEAWTALHQGIPYRLGVPHTLDDKRAVLGFYHLSSLVSSLFKRGPQFSWTPYLSRCCDSLIDAREHESDFHLVALVKLQRIADRAYSILPTPGGMTRDTCTYRAALDMAINQVRHELDAFVALQPDIVKQNKIFSSCYRVLIMRLYEPALVMKTPPLSDSDSLISEPFLRADALGNCLESSRESFAALLSIPSVQLSQLPLTGTALLAFTIVTSCRLMFLDTLPDWQPEVARKRLDLGAALGGVADNFAVADRWAVEKNRKRRLKEDCDNRGCHYTSRLRWIRQWYLSKTGGQDVQPQSEENADEQVRYQWTMRLGQM
ncbi:fungal transcriptional regulatory protein [Pochonia chlamydosporia 170]|uniref:Fungal transcriptional regulatory protein n=1 Tax=Pochonia chlamydosporia 170 TaxID=1380566 RepID=A0A179FLT1_METCM|nr:fungal transcriptional regulatory protein [Pochonia chlamydosporia 170]OAQ66003.1 fungal transcriptional regulatory protein [Pochonia chlamydosporia 170]